MLAGIADSWLHAGIAAPVSTMHWSDPCVSIVVLKGDTFTGILSVARSWFLAGRQILSLVARRLHSCELRFLSWTCRLKRHLLRLSYAGIFDQQGLLIEEMLIVSRGGSASQGRFQRRATGNIVGSRDEPVVPKWQKRVFHHVAQTRMKATPLE